MPEGFFKDVLRLSVQPPGDSRPQSHELVVQGKVLRRLSLYGRRIDSGGVVDLGVVSRGEVARAELIAKVRDERRDLPIRSIETKPHFLRVRLKPHGPDAKERGLYRFTVEAPRDSPPCAFTGMELGRIRIEFDHPRIQELTLSVKFAVTSDT
jgi:hypothetical protein